MGIHRHIREQIGLAGFYAEDGAFHSAARVLRDLADQVEDHAKKCDAFIEHLIAKGEVEREKDHG
ncbi:MAG: hypothetical protein J0H60_09735 [Rhizobiales bacterium]|nr:hypothetical protein [Hyphomicrobiales bacterium]